MSDSTMDSAITARPEPEAAQPKGGRKPALKAMAAKKPSPAKKSKTKADRSNKKAEVIALMKRAKGGDTGGVMKATGWQPHTVRGFIGILGKKGGEKIESSKSAAGERT